MLKDRRFIEDILKKSKKNELKVSLTIDLTLSIVEVGLYSTSVIDWFTLNTTIMISHIKSIVVGVALVWRMA